MNQHRAILSGVEIYTALRVHERTNNLITSGCRNENTNQNHQPTSRVRKVSKSAYNSGPCHGIMKDVQITPGFSVFLNYAEWQEMHGVFNAFLRSGAWA
jgi:hypothetical protein